MPPLPPSSILLAPSCNGDPFTAIDLNLNAGILLTGSASGRCITWDVSQLLDSKRAAPVAPAASNARSNGLTNGQHAHTNGHSSHTADKRKDEFTNLNTPAAPQQLPPLQGANEAVTPHLHSDISTRTRSYHTLCAASDEGIRHIMFGSDGCVFAVVGDLNIKFWHSIAASDCQTLRVQRTHDYSSCNSTVAMRHEEHILLLTPGTSTGLHIDLQTGDQTPYRVSVPRFTVPVYFNNKCLAWLQTADDQTKQLVVLSYPTNDVLFRHTFARRHKHYAGFQLNDKSLIHVCCSNRIKIWKLDQLRPAAKSNSADTAKQQPTINATKAHRKLVGHRGRIVNLLLATDDQYIVSLSNAGEIFVWSTTTNYVKKYTDIDGEFALGYPYLLQRYGSWVVYTADAGVYALDFSNWQKAVR